MTMRGIDTLAVARKLESAGVGRGQAEAHAEALNEVVVITYSDLATKADLERFATRKDLERFATKEDLRRFATKEDLLKFATKADLERFATKADLERFATKADLERFATKEDLERLTLKFATKEDLERLTLKFVTKEDLKDYPTRDEMNLAFARFEKRMIVMWASSTVSLAGLIIAMPFVGG